MTLFTELIVVRKNCCDWELNGSKLNILNCQKILEISSKKFKIQKTVKNTNRNSNVPLKNPHKPNIACLIPILFYPLFFFNSTFDLISISCVWLYVRQTLNFKYLMSIAFRVEMFIQSCMKFLFSSFKLFLSYFFRFAFAVTSFCK